ncbi:hypothetical protein Bbelb_221450 [Branchiostoma belcheri]|nr:hypothetical protein Bbelb_221450 [Branchiostoma belcheri]
MAEELNSDAVPSVVRNDSFSDSTTEPGTRTVPPTVKQTDEDVNNYISGTCEENEHDDDEHISIQSGAAFENRETIHISPGDFDTYAIAYTCKEHDTRIKKNVEETKSKPFQGSKTSSSNHNESDIHLAECGSAQNYTDTFKGNDVYPHLQNTIEPSNASPGSAFMSSMPSGDIPCTLTSADTHQQEEHMYQNNLECNAALSDTQPELPSQNLPSAASNDINDVSSNPLSNINGVLNALNPNPLYVPNVQKSAACGVSSVPTFSAVSNTSRRSVTQKWRDDHRCGDGYTTGDGRTAECDPYSTWPCCSSANWCGNTAEHCYCAGCVYYHNSESGDRKLENIITIGGEGKEPIIRMAYGVAVSADNEIFVTDAKGVQVFSINGNYLRYFRTALPGKNGVIDPYDVAIGIEPGHLWVVGAKVHVVHVVKYSRSGQAMKNFAVGFRRPIPFSPPLPVIAIDVRSNKIIVGQGNTVKLFDQDSSLYRSFKVLSGRERGIGGVISDSDGNILLTVTGAYKAVKSFSHSGVKIFEFAGRGAGQRNFFTGICRDKLSNIFVADNGNNRVDMFTSRGEFVRTIADIQDPSDIAMGPDGEMVVTSTSAGARSTVTIVPRHMVFP